MGDEQSPKHFSFFFVTKKFIQEKMKKLNIEENIEESTPRVTISSNLPRLFWK